MIFEILPGDNMGFLNLATLFLKLSVSEVDLGWLHKNQGMDFDQILGYGWQALGLSKNQIWG